VDAVFFSVARQEKRAKKYVRTHQTFPNPDHLSTALVVRAFNAMLDRRCDGCTKLCMHTPGISICIFPAMDKCMHAWDVHLSFSS